MAQTASPLLCDLVLQDAWREVSRQYPVGRLHVGPDGHVLKSMEDAVNRAMNDGVVDYEQLLVAALSVSLYREIELAGSARATNHARHQAAKLIRKIRRRPAATVGRRH